MYNTRIYYILASIILFIATIAVVSSHGLSNRSTARESTTHLITAPEQAYQIWQNERVKGRILLLFDNYPHFRGRINYQGSPKLDSSNFVEIAIFNNIIRKIYFIVPDDKWADFRSQDAITNPIREFDGADLGVYLFTLNGTPLIAVPRNYLPQLAEKPLVYINTAVFNRLHTLELLALKNISSDCIISLQRDTK